MARPPPTVPFKVTVPEMLVPEASPITPTISVLPLLPTRLIVVGTEMLVLGPNMFTLTVFEAARVMPDKISLLPVPPLILPDWVKGLAA